MPLFKRKNKKYTNLDNAVYQNLTSSDAAVSNNLGNFNQLLSDESENETTLLSEQLFESDNELENETTLLSEQLCESNNESENETTLLSEQLFKSNDEYEGQTSLLSEEFSPYSHGDVGRPSNRVQDSSSTSQKMCIPDMAKKAYLIRIIKSEKIQISKIKFVIGSGKDADYSMENSTVSKKHAFIIFKDNEYYMIDNKSTNKTFIDGVMLEPQKSVKLYHGALIQFSNELFQFMLD